MVYCCGDRSVVHSSERCEFFLNSSPCIQLTTRKFYCEEHFDIGENYTRLAFCKDVDTLRRAGERLQKLVKYLS